ncbi:hypothetical protein ACM7GH_29285 [Pseudomonas aeruginosa]
MQTEPNAAAALREIRIILRTALYDTNEQLEQVPAGRQAAPELAELLAKMEAWIGGESP